MAKAVDTSCMHASAASRRLPALLPPAEGSIARWANAPRSWRVLVLEHDVADAERVREIVERAPVHSVEILQVTSLREAAPAVANTQLDVIILDLALPDAAGSDSIRRVQELFVGVPIIVTAERLDEELRRRILREGAVEAFAKHDESMRWLVRFLPHVVERGRAERERRELERVLAAIPDAIVVARTGQAYYVNEAACALFDCPRDDFPSELFGASSTEGAAMELTFVRRGEQRICQMRTVPLAWQGDTALLVSLRDITEQRNGDLQVALADRMRSIGALASGVAHEVNHPLASLIANIELVLSEARSVPGMLPLVLENLQDARRAANTIRGIVRDLGLFSWSEGAGQVPLDVHEVIDSTARLISNDLGRRARVVREYGPVPRIDANDARLRHVVLSLLVNAVQSIAPGNIADNEIRITTGTDREGRLSISIADSGAGMPDEVHRRRFTPFATTKPSEPSFGLAICQHIVTGFGGTVSFTSEIGSGTCFNLSLPAAIPALPTYHEASESPFAKRRARVLVIDDDEMLLRGIARALGKEHDVVAVERASEALHRLERGERYDAILSDVMMPQMTGVELYAAIAGQNRGDERRVAFVTGGALKSGIRQSLESLPNRRIEKPFTVTELRSLVAELIATASCEVSDDD